jgi:hypothetical protein
LNFEDRVGDRPTLEVRPPGEQEVDHRGEAEHVARRADVLLIHDDQLGGGVTWRPDRGAPEGGGDAGRSCDTEVCHFEDLVVPEAAAQDVLGFQIAMDDTDLVNGREPLAEALDRVGCASGVERVPRLADAVRDPIGQGGSLGAAVHVLHGQPRKFHPSRAGVDHHAADLDEAQDERGGGHPFVEAAEGHGLLLYGQAGRVAESANEAWA